MDIPHHSGELEVSKTSNRHPSPLWRTWGQRGLQVKRHSVLSSLLTLKCHKTEGWHSWKVLWKESLPAGVWAVTGLCSQTSKSLGTSWASAATVIETRVAEWKAHCVRKRTRRNWDAACDTPTSTLWDRGEFLRLGYTHGFPVLAASAAGLLVKTDWKREISGTSRPSLLCTEHVIRRLWRMLASCAIPACEFGSQPPCERAGVPLQSTEQRERYQLLPSLPSVPQEVR